MDAILYRDYDQSKYSSEIARLLYLATATNYRIPRIFWPQILPLSPLTKPITVYRGIKLYTGRCNKKLARARWSLAYPTVKLTIANALT